jgi:hypothetical protein
MLSRLLHSAARVAGACLYERPRRPSPDRRITLAASTPSPNTSTSTCRSGGPHRQRRYHRPHRAQHRHRSQLRIAVSQDPPDAAGPLAGAPPKPGLAGCSTEGWLGPRILVSALTPTTLYGHRGSSHEIPILSNSFAGSRVAQRDGAHAVNPPEREPHPGGAAAVAKS